MNRRYVLLSLVLACGGPETTETPGPNAEAAGAPTGPPTYELHEWGLLDISRGQVEIAAGPGAPERRPTHPTGGRRKPVIYVHANQPVQFSLAVHTSGPVAEHWPPSTVEGQSVRWNNVEARPGACSPQGYPTAQSPECQNAPDGYCELADLHGYESADGACLTFGGRSWDHLFYRSGGRAPSIPIGVTARPDGSVEVRNNALTAPQGGVYRLRRIGAQTITTRIDMPAVGEAAIFAPDAAAAPVREELSGLLRAGGLTDSEAAAFERAWYAELFENGDTGGAPVVPDALIFILPPEHLDVVSRIEATPPPAQIRRMFWVRFDLPDYN